MAVVDYLFHASPWGFVHSFSYELLFFHHLYRLLFFLAQAEKRTNGVQQSLVIRSCVLFAETMWISYHALLYEGVILVTVGFLSIFGNGSWRNIPPDREK